MKMMTKACMVVAFGLVMGPAVPNAQASSILYQTAQGGYTSNVLFGSQWTVFSGYMTGAHSLTSTTDFSSLAQLLLYDAVWVDQELGNTLSGAEIGALTSYVSSGHKAVLIGENGAWVNWNNSLMSVAGGTVTPECSGATGTPNVAHPLTAGVTTVTSVCGSVANAAAGAQVLFSNGLAALYTIGAGQALVILDSNWNDNTYRTLTDNDLFAHNVVNWLTPSAPAAVPEPATLVLLGSGLALGVLRRRRPKVN